MSKHAYAVETVDAGPLTKRLNVSRISGPLRVIPAPYEQSSGFRASKLAECMRMTGYRLAKAKTTHDTYNPDWTLSADLGTAIHVRIQEQLVGSGLVVSEYGEPAIEVTVKHGELSGHIDAVIRTNSGRLAIFDIKTGGPKEFVPNYRYLADKWSKWAVQMHVYMAHFAMPDGEIAREAFIYHINRGDTEQRNLFRIPWQPGIYAKDEQRLLAAQSAIIAGTLPLAEPGGCRFCSWRGLCDANTWRD